MGDPLFDVDNGMYISADGLPLSLTSKQRLRDLQRRWTAANERYLTGGAIDAPVDRDFDADVVAVELRIRRELGGSSWALVRGGPRKVGRTHSH